MSGDGGGVPPSAAFTLGAACLSQLPSSLLEAGVGSLLAEDALRHVPPRLYAVRFLTARMVLTPRRTVQDSIRSLAQHDGPDH